MFLQKTVGKVIRKNQRLNSNRWLKANKENSGVFTRCLFPAVVAEKSVVFEEEQAYN